MQNPQNLIWIDLEMTGLNPDTDVIIEMATIVTDSNLNTLAEGPVIAIHHSDAVLATMDEWNTRTHGNSGLTQRVRDSRISLAEAEAETIAFLEKWVPKGKSPICGNSICQDRRFLYTHMKALESYFHYRNLDVSTLKELAARWAPEVKDSFHKGSTHLALDDIRESIAELQHYRKHFIKARSYRLAGLLWVCRGERACPALGRAAALIQPLQPFGRISSPNIGAATQPSAGQARSPPHASSAQYSCKDRHHAVDALPHRHHRRSHDRCLVRRSARHGLVRRGADRVRHSPWRRFGA